MTSPVQPVPTEQERAKAFELSEMPPRTNTALIADALATARIRGEAAGLERAAHECEEAAAEYDAAGQELAAELDDRILKREANLATSAKRKSCQRLADRIRALKGTTP